MIKVKITKDMMDWANEKTKVHIKGQKFIEGVNKHNSVLIGYLGDSVFQNQYPDAKHVDRSNCDFIYINIEIDVKTWWSKFPPQISYYVQIPTVDIIRHPEVYVFVCLMDGYEYGYLVGHRDSFNYKSDATFHRKGEYSERAGGIKYSTNCWELPVSKLNQFESDNGRPNSLIIEF